MRNLTQEELIKFREEYNDIIISDPQKYADGLSKLLGKFLSNTLTEKDLKTLEQIRDRQKKYKP